jgi:hypothetical protein
MSSLNCVQDGFVPAQQANRHLMQVDHGLAATRVFADYVGQSVVSLICFAIFTWMSHSKKIVLGCEARYSSGSLDHFQFKLFKSVFTIRLMQSWLRLDQLDQVFEVFRSRALLNLSIRVIGSFHWSTRFSCRWFGFDSARIESRNHLGFERGCFLLIDVVEVFPVLISVRDFFLLLKKPGVHLFAFGMVGPGLFVQLACRPEVIAMLLKLLFVSGLLMKRFEQFLLWLVSSRLAALSGSSASFGCWLRWF